MCRGCTCPGGSVTSVNRSALTPGRATLLGLDRRAGKKRLWRKPCAAVMVSPRNHELDQSRHAATDPLVLLMMPGLRARVTRGTPDTRSDSTCECSALKSNDLVLSPPSETPQKNCRRRNPITVTRRYLP